MMRWSDLGAGLRAGTRLLFRLELWLQVLRRMFFSRVFLGYALCGGLLFMAGRQVFLDMQRGSSGGVLLLLLAGGAIYVLLAVLGALLLPYAYWVFNPPAARLLQRYVDLPSAVEEEPWFGTYLWWTLPVLGTTLLALAAHVVPAPAPWQRTAIEVGAGLLVTLAVMTLFTRSALSTVYARADVERFVRVTRWQRRLVWLPLLAAFGWAMQLLMTAVLHLAPLGWMLQFFTPTGFTTTFVLTLVVDLLVSALVTMVFITALLLACGRMPSDGEGGTASTGIHSITRPMTQPVLPPRGRPRAPQQQRPASRARLAWVLALALLAVGAYAGRLAIADRVLSFQEGYREAPARMAALGQPLLLTATAEQRLHAGYLDAACSGNTSRMRWLRRVGLRAGAADAAALACAVCQGHAETAQWLLATNTRMRVDGATLPGTGRSQPRRDALSCAARQGDMPMVQALLARGAKPLGLGGRESALDVAAARLDWPMLALLVRREQAAGTAIFPALEAARAQGVQRPAELLPRMLDAGLSLNARDPFGRSVFHWAAVHGDLPLARALLEHVKDAPQVLGPAGADLQGAQPWMLVLRHAQVQNRPVTNDTVELLRLLLPSDADINAAARRSPDARRDDALPDGWNARELVLNDAAVRAAFGPSLDLGRLPAEAASAWKFTSAESAGDFVRTATPTQLMRAENPDAPAGVAPVKLSTALELAGWPELAREVRLAVAGKRS